MDRRIAALLAAVLVVPLVGGCAAGSATVPASQRAVAQAPDRAADAVAAVRARPDRPGRQSRPRLEVSPFPTQVTVPGPPAEPALLRIAAIGVETRLVPLGLDAGGDLQVPEEFGRAGWYTGGPTPGEQGPAVIAGHVDSRSGPAVFYRLRELAPGDVVRVRRADGTTLRFTVEGVHQYPKAALPRAAVFGPVPYPALRLVTCGGTFDHRRRSYRDNLVVDARLTGFSRSGP
jgi:Sortase domain